MLAGAGPAGAAPPSLAFTPSPYSYGQVTVGQTASQTFTVANSGGSASAALTLSLSGSSAFTVTTDTCTGTSLGPGKSCTVSVQFAPTSAGSKAATLTAASKKATATDSLTGTGATAGAGHLYWAGYTAGTINEANLDGTSPQAIVAGQTYPAGVAVSG